MTLTRRLGEKFGDTDRKFTSGEAFEALMAQSESEEARRRKNIAAAEASEINVLNKRKQFLFREDHVNSVKDLAAQVRVTIESARYLKEKDRRRLAKEIAEIKPLVAEPSHK